jgi:glycosyltransferase involved in cell wall biosynthesis
MVQAMADSRIRLLDQPNGGVSTARNAGLSVARYDFIALLDADDEWDSRFLEKMAVCIRNCPDAGLYFAARIDRSGPKGLSTTVPTLPAEYCGYVDIFSLDAILGPSSSSVVLRSSFLDKTGLFDPNLQKGEDVDMWIRFALNGPVVLYNAPLALYHNDAENRAMLRPTPPHMSLVSNLSRYDSAVRTNPRLYRYLQGMRLGHICNFLGNRPCELANPHEAIDQLDLTGLPFVWMLIQHSPPFLRRLIFRVYIHGHRLFERVQPMPKRRI